MGCMILVEGLDLAGKSTLIRGLEQRFKNLGWQAVTSHGDLCRENPVARVTRKMMRWDPGFNKREGAPLFLASHLWDERNFRLPDCDRYVHIQDSCALRSLAFEKILGEPFYAEKLSEVVDRLPKFQASYVLTAGLKNRMERFLKREQNDLHDSFMLSDPVRFGRVDGELLKLGAERLGAKLVCTDELGPDQLLNFIWEDLCRRLELSATSNRALAG